MFNRGLVGTNVLGNGSRFTFYHCGFANRIKKRSFTVVYMAHNHNNGRPFLQILLFFKHGTNGWATVFTLFFYVF